ncbi:hypothetical protein ACFYRY_32125 [Streptomyces sp. NPDC005263]|uniref:hypothetical protein n=1 Tax=Streptomyces sp. NPDC005263 TaxID=3364711 RepID=UPI0036C37691
MPTWQIGTWGAGFRPSNEHQSPRVDLVAEPGIEGSISSGAGDAVLDATGPART